MLQIYFFCTNTNFMITQSWITVQKLTRHIFLMFLYEVRLGIKTRTIQFTHNHVNNGQFVAQPHHSR